MSNSSEVVSKMIQRELRGSIDLTGLYKQLQASAGLSNTSELVSKMIQKELRGSINLTGLSKQLQASAGLSNTSELVSKMIQRELRGSIDLTGLSKRLQASAGLSNNSELVTAMIRKDPEFANLTQRVADIMRGHPQESARLIQQIDEQLAEGGLVEEGGLDEEAESDVLPAGKQQQALAFVLALYVYTVLVGVDIAVLDEGHPVLAKITPDADITALISLFFVIYGHLKGRGDDSTSS